MPLPLLVFPSPAALAAASAAPWAVPPDALLIDEDPACPAPPPPPPPPPAAAPNKRVSFAPGPLPHTPDGHPQGDGRTVPPRLSPSRLGLVPAWTLKANAHPPEPLTPHNIRVLAAELGPENAASITRLKRRAGLEPPLKRPPPPKLGW